MSKTRADLEKEIIELKKKIERFKKDKSLYISNQEFLKKLAEKSGSEKAVYQQQVILSQEKIKYLEAEVVALKNRLNILMVNNNEKE